MGKYKTGDRVRIKSGLKVDKKYGGLRLNAGMYENVKMIGVVRNYLFDDCCEVDFSNNPNLIPFAYTDDMLEPAGFTKADLEPCMVVVTRDGSIAIVAMSRDCGMVLNFKDGSWTNLKDYSDGLESATREENDITEVYGLSGLSFKANEISTDNRELLWKREEPKPKRKMTVAEICNGLGEENEIVKGENS